MKLKTWTETVHVFAQVVWCLFLEDCHTKIGPPKIGPAGPILAENFAKVGPPRTTFAAKIGPAGPVLAAKTGPPLPILVPL